MGIESNGSQNTRSLFVHFLPKSTTFAQNSSNFSSSAFRAFLASLHTRRKSSILYDTSVEAVTETREI